MGIVAAWAKRKAENTQLYSEKPPKSLTMVGIAVETMVPSMAVMNMASMTEAKIKGRAAFPSARRRTAFPPYRAFCALLLQAYLLSAGPGVLDRPIIHLNPQFSGGLQRPIRI